MGRWGPWMVGRLERWPIVLSFAGALLVLWTTRWPVEGWRFSLLDMKFYGKLGEWRDRLPGMSGVDAAYTAGLVLSGAAIFWWMIRVGLRIVGVIWYRPPAGLRGRFWRRSMLLLLLAGVTVVGIGVGWPYRLGQRWAREWETKGHPIVAPFALPLLESAGAYAPLRAVVLQGRTARERRSGMKMLTEAWINCNFDHGAILREILESEKDLGNRVLALHLSGEFGDPELEPVLAARLNDPLPEIRIAAADGLGICWNGIVEGAPQIPGDTNTGDPPVDWMGSYRPRSAARATSTRGRLEAMMLTATTLDEREAATKALVYAPAPGYQLRYAEWGVLIGEGPGKIRFTNALRDDVPPFVHRIGNPAAEFESRITHKNPAGMGKPVVHLTVDRPMAVDVEIYMNDGRPWVAYPLFDDLVLLQGSFGESSEPKGMDYQPFGPRLSIRMLDPKGLTPLTDLREGYSWMSPRRREYPWYDPTGQYNMTGRADLEKLAAIAGMGMRWQSLIVTPTPVAFTHLADVPAEARYDWWKRLRETPCSWISSRGESERFLYYDGPTIMPSPVIMKLENGELKWTQTDYARPSEPERPKSVEDKHMRSALYVEVHGGNIRGFWIDNDYLQGENSMAVSERLEAGSTIRAADFAARLIKHGLNEDEAAAMVACWKKTFFETDGWRALVILSQADYESLCPMTVRPWPTQVARVGVVWTEFSE